MVLDPCCGSGHFLTEALAILVAMRRAEEGISAADAATAALRDNLFGLEIDGRCVQLAAFAVALAAWRLGDWQSLPLPHIAWSGAPPPLPKPQFVALANGNTDLAPALAAIHDLFLQAPLLGSLVEPIGGDLIDPTRVARVEAMLEPVIERARAAEPERAEDAIAASGMADAAAILARRYTLQATNVPFLGRSKQAPTLAAFIARSYTNAKADLATAMLSRMLKLAAPGGTLAAVTPQNWLFLGSYTAMRRQMLEYCQFNLLCDLGPAAFNEMNWWAARTALVTCSNVVPGDQNTYFGLDADTGRELHRKPQVISIGQIKSLQQKAQLRNPDHRILVKEPARGALLVEYAVSPNGMHGGDSMRFRRKYWETCLPDPNWTFFQLTVEQSCDFGGREHVFWWKEDGRIHRENPSAYVKGMAAWCKDGVVVSVMRNLPVTRYTGEKYDISCTPIIPLASAHLPAIWAFCTSPDYLAAVRTIDLKTNVTNGTLVKVPFDHGHWERIASTIYPAGLPEPYSDDPTQWLFHGHPAQAEKGTALHIAVVRLCGYRWPAETDTKMRLSAEARDWIAKAATLAAGGDDGLLTLPAVAGERPLVERLRGYLGAAFGKEWSDGLERRLVADADEVLDKRSARDGSLETWLRDRAFRQHCVLFHQRPFLWHVWDGQADGFAALLHYHRLTRTNLEKLTYVLLGDWIIRTRDAGDRRRLEAAQILQEKLQAVLKGESPLDIFVRWKPLAAQPIGWEPDLDDGVRLNIRPFMRAEVLRDTPSIHWRKDRGKDVSSAPWYGKFNGERARTFSGSNVSRCSKRAHGRLCTRSVKPNFRSFE